MIDEVAVSARLASANHFFAQAFLFFMENILKTFDGRSGSARKRIIQKCARRKKYQGANQQEIFIF